jgi:hypothetical protein
LFVKKKIHLFRNHLYRAIADFSCIMAQKSGIENKVSGIGKQRPKMITVLRAPKPEHILPLYAPYPS